MKFTIILVLMSLFLASCGGDKNSSGSSNSNAYNSTGMTTQEGYYDIQTQNLEVGGQTYPPNQQYQAVMNQAIQQAQAQQIQPVSVNGVQKFRARITAQLINYNQNNGYNSSTSGYNTGYAQNSLNISNVVFY